MRTRNIDGETLVQCLTRGDWVREDLLVNRFSVAAKRMMAGSEYHLLAYASSIIEALAQATAYAITIDPESELFTLQIAMDDAVVSSTRLISAGADKARPGKHRLPIRLDWGGSGSKELNDEAFRHAAIKVEKHFGKRWSLVKKLEDELGL